MITIVTILIHLGCQQWELKHRVNWTCDISYVLGSHLTFLALMAMLASECLPYRPINVGRFYERILCFKLHGKKNPMAFKFELLFFFLVICLLAIWISSFEKSTFSCSLLILFFILKHMGKLQIYTYKVYNKLTVLQQNPRLSILLYFVHPLAFLK